MTVPDAAKWTFNHCPICEREHAVTPFTDVCVPACGCYDDAAKGEQPCEPCGIDHALNCPRMPGHDPSRGKREVVHPWREGERGSYLGGDPR